MTTQKDQPRRLLTRASECRCQNCPPNRVCAWDCVQGAGTADILIGAVLEQSQSWALETSEPGLAAANQGLWESFNA